MKNSGPGNEKNEISGPGPDSAKTSGPDSGPGTRYKPSMYPYLMLQLALDPALAKKGPGPGHLYKKCKISTV